MKPLPLPFSFPLAFALAVTGTSTTAQVNRDDLTPLEISYETAVKEDRKGFRVRMDVENVSRPRIHVAMPAWSPGAYGIRDYGDGVQELRALGSDDAELEITRMDTGTWSIDTRGSSRVTITYEVDASRRRRWGRSSEDEEEKPVTGMQINGPGTYLYVRGAKDVPVSSSYDVPDGWGIANGLLETDVPYVRTARDYDTFIDAPTILGEYEERRFEVNGTPFWCVFFENEQTYDFDIDAFVDIVRRIVVNQGELYGSYPFPNYVFLFTLPGGGGLEHLNSTSIGLRADAQKEDPEAGASVTSHEFFHTWNVKRIRPKTLGPFDYQQENYTGNLWVSEGWTSYFGELTLARTGILTPEEYLEHLERIVNREQNKGRRKEHSVVWASRNTWHRFPEEEGSRVDYYGKGELLGALIDLEMRRATGGTKSLNDVMRFMNRWFAEHDVGFEEGDVERACTAISNHDFGEFFARYVYGTMDPPLAEIFSVAGVQYDEEIIPCSFPFDLRGSRVWGRFRRPDPEEDPGPDPRPGDTVKALDGEPFEDVHAFLRGRAAGDVVVVTLERRGEEHDVDVTLSDEPILIGSLSFREDVSEQELAIREAWLTSVE